MSDLHKIWQGKKDLAEKLYKLGIAKRHAKLRKELQDEIDKIDKEDRDAGMLQRWKRQAVEIQRITDAEKNFPVKFDGGLGPKLEKLYAIFMKKETSASDEKLRQQISSDILLVMTKYRQLIASHEADFDKASPDIAPMLIQTLKDLQKVLPTQVRANSERLAEMVIKYPEAIKAWQTAKKESESAYKKLTKDKEAMLYLKAEKYDAYPLKFNGGLVPAMQDVAKQVAKHEITKLRETALKAWDTAEAYEKQIKVAEQKYEKIIPKKSGSTRDIIEPLVEALGNLKSELRQAAGKG